MKKEYDFSELKELKNPYPGNEKAVGTNLSVEVFGNWGRELRNWGQTGRFLGNWGQTEGFLIFVSTRFVLLATIRGFSELGKLLVCPRSVPLRRRVRHPKAFFRISVWPPAKID